MEKLNKFLLVTSIIFILTGCSGNGALDSSDQLKSANEKQQPKASKQINAAFTHRGLVGWINDFRRDRLPNPNWPNVTIDNTTIADITEQLDFMQRTGLNEIVIWGLFTAEGWAPDIVSTVDTTRQGQVKEIISRAHARGIKVLAGLGVYSWGFKRILDADPSVRCASNSDVLNPAAAKSWDYQRAVIDYVFDNYAIDGVSAQSADRGRCYDGTAQSDVAYHADIIEKTAAHIKSKNPAYIVGVANWGLDMTNPNDLPEWVRMTRHVDYIAEASTALGNNRPYRQQLAAAIAPAVLGNLGSPFIEPVEHLENSRYFVPTFKLAAAGLKSLYEDGGRAVETYVRRLGNAGDVITIEATAQLESNVNADTELVLRDAIGSIYGISDANAISTLVSAYSNAESAYFNAAGINFDIVLSSREATTTVLSDLLWARMSQETRTSFFAALQTPLAQLRGLQGSPLIANQALLNSAIESLSTQIDNIRSLGINSLNDPCYLANNITPANNNASDGSAYELGTRVRVTSNAKATHLRFWKAINETSAAHQGSIWDARGNKLASVTLPASAGSGWVEAQLDTPLSLLTGQDYIVSVAIQSHFAVSSALNGQNLSCPSGLMQAPATSAAAPNGLFGPAGQFPTQTYNGNFYFVDLLVVPDQNEMCYLTPSNLLPTIADATDGTSYELGTRIRVKANAKATRVRFWKAPSESNAEHVATFWDSKGGILSRMTLPPSNTQGWVEVTLPNPIPLQAGQDYIVSVGIRSHFAVASVFNTQGLTCPTGQLVAPQSTPNAPNGVFGSIGNFPNQTYNGNYYFIDVSVVDDAPCSLAPSTLTPSAADASDGTSYELGTRVRVTKPTQATKLRYWKSVSESNGEHIGTIWDSAGNKLANVTFSATSVSGWQEASLTTPLNLAPGVDYIVSVAIQSHFAVSSLFNGKDLACPTGQLLAPASTATAPNGVFGNIGVFPTQSYNGNFYFVDLVVN